MRCSPIIMPLCDQVSAEQYRYALQNFRIAHEQVEKQRQQLEEQERQVALLRQRIAVLEGGDNQGLARTNQRQGGSSVDDFSIKVTLSGKYDGIISLMRPRYAECSFETRAPSQQMGSGCRQSSTKYHGRSL